jgi:arylsulfatase A-like enzyme
MGKQNLYDHSLRVPLIFAGPGIPIGEGRDALCYLSDIFPTVCDLLHLPCPASVEGRSLTACLEDVAHDALYFAYTCLARGVCVGDFKLIEYAVSETQLFDLGSDPAEQCNLIKDRPEVLDKLRRRLLAFRNDGRCLLAGTCRPG